MNEPLSLLSLLDWPLGPQEQSDYFKATHLADLFNKKIAKSQATGSDGIRIKRFQAMLAAETLLIERKFNNGTYKFTNFKERLLLRGADRNPRQISIPTVRDRLALRAVCQVLHKFEEKTVGTSPHALVSRVVKSIRSGDQSGKSFVRIDVKDFFPSISHRLLNKELERFHFDQKVRALCMKAVATRTGQPEDAPIKGVPQGLSISGALAALYMLRFDAREAARDTEYFRYVDDILLIENDKEADETLKRLSRALKTRGLIIHAKGVAGKTEISPVAKGVDFLGYNISISKVSVRKSSYRKMFKNVLKVITDFKYRRNTDRLIFRLNLKTTGCIVDGKRRGWMMFFSQTEDLNQLAHLDAFVIRQLSRVGFPEEQKPSIKRFLKSYHEIRYKLGQTSYIPNFDRFDSQAKAEAIAALSNRTLAEALAMDIETIETEFSRLISREVHDLEQDVGNPS